MKVGTEGPDDDDLIESARDMEFLCKRLLALEALAERAAIYRYAPHAFEHELLSLTEGVFERADRLRAREYARSIGISGADLKPGRRQR